jgi:hypothetical protein
MRLISSCPDLNNIHCKNRLVKITNLVEFRLSQSQTQNFTNILLVLGDRFNSVDLLYYFVVTVQIYSTSDFTVGFEILP